MRGKPAPKPTISPVHWMESMDSPVYQVHSCVPSPTPCTGPGPHAESDPVHWIQDCKDCTLGPGLCTGHVLGLICHAGVAATCQIWPCMWAPGQCARPNSAYWLWGFMLGINLYTNSGTMFLVEPHMLSLRLHTRSRAMHWVWPWTNPEGWSNLAWEAMSFIQEQRPHQSRNLVGRKQWQY